MRAARFAADEPLDEYGMRHALAAAGAFRPDGRRVVCDGSQRTRQTAAALGLGLGPGPDSGGTALDGGTAQAAIENHPGLRDLDVGMWRGRSLDEIPADELGRWLGDVTYAPAGGESIDQLLARVRTWLRHRAAEPGRIIAVTHPAVVRAALVAALRCPPEVFWRIDVAPLTSTVLYHRGRDLPPDEDLRAVEGPAGDGPAGDRSAGDGSAGGDTGWTLTRACHPL